jgi:hypothetical protein
VDKAHFEIVSGFAGFGHATHTNRSAGVCDHNGIHKKVGILKVNSF